MVQKLPRSTCLDGGFYPGKFHGISTTNLRQLVSWDPDFSTTLLVCENCQGCKFSPCLNLILSDQKSEVRLGSVEGLTVQKLVQRPQEKWPLRRPEILFSPCFGGVA